MCIIILYVKFLSLLLVALLQFYQQFLCAFAQC